LAVRATATPLSQIVAIVSRPSATRLDHYPVLPLVGPLWPALVGLLVTLGALALSGWRHDRWLLLPAGLLLLAVTAANDGVDLAGSWAAWWATTAPRDGFLEAGFLVSLPTNRFLQPSEATEAAVALAGPVLVALGALRRHRETEPHE
ncbi:aminopeptidase, partial [Asanoa sp. NPDC050611]